MHLVIFTSYLKLWHIHWAYSSVMGLIGKPQVPTLTYKEGLKGGSKYCTAGQPSFVFSPLTNVAPVSQATNTTFLDGTKYSNDG